jgi:phosphatidylserine/phosphatidylglycerophosphate/cardiolipin synthase-like enzyme
VLAATLVGCSTPVDRAGSDVDESASPTHPAPATPPAALLAGSPDVRIIVEPSDHGSALIDAINAATTSVHVTMYLLTDTDVLNALVARHNAGVEVKIVLNQRFDTPGNPNQITFDQLQHAGVPVVWSPSTFTFTHEKCVVIDQSTAWIMTMNASKSSVSKNREYLAVDTTAADVVEAEAQFAADFAGQPYTPTGNLLMSPVTARPGIASLIQSATHSIDFEVEEMSDTAIATELCAAAGRSVVVRGVISTTSRSAAAQRTLTQLQGCGAKLVSLSHPYIHAKAIVVDGTSIYVGSANYTQTSLDHNRELGLVTSNPAAVSAVATSVAADITAGTGL